MISDTYGVFVYDADAGFVRGYPASLDYRFHGWRNGVMVMKHKDGTLFDCLTGLAFDGPRKGEQLVPIATIESNWGAWLKAHPGTVAYAMVPRFRPEAIPTAALADSRKTRCEPDPRLSAEERVFGLSLGGESKAWPLIAFGAEAALRTTTLGGTKVVVLWDGETRSALAFAPETDDTPSEPVHLEIKPGQAGSPWVDRQTGSRWSIVGRAESGTAQRQNLAPGCPA